MNDYIVEIVAEYLANEMKKPDVAPWESIADQAKKINKYEGWHFDLHFDGPNQFIRYSEHRLSANDLSRVIKKAKELL